jgi:choline dehydrogenase-like flavoprotein
MFDEQVHLAKGLGGCSIHNAMLYMRGVLADFELWHPEWSWTRVLPYYIKVILDFPYTAHYYDACMMTE